jgi:hypothetical protein
MSTVKRVFFYTVSFVTLGTSAGGVGMLLALCFDILIRGETWRGFARAQLSLGLAMLIISGVLWFLFWRVIQRQVSENPAEIGSGIRKLFLNVTRGVAALVGLTAAVGFLRWLMAGVLLTQFPSVGLAILIVTAGIWYYHWRVEEREGQPSSLAKTLRRWYVYVLSGFGLVWLAEGLIQLVNAAIFCLPVWGGDAIHGGFWNYGVQDNIGWILIGGLTWAFHWFYMARGDYESTLRQVYMYLLAILGGAMAGLVALTTSLFYVFRFAFSGVGAAGDRYFLFLGWTIPTMLVAAAIWTYHQKTVQEEAAQLRERMLSTRRVYLYLMSFIGLGTLIAGLITLLGILLNLWINAASSGAVVTSGWWHDQLSVCLALLLVGTPLWLFYWRGVLQMVVEGGVAERGVMSRRIFLYVVLGIAVITLAADLVYIIYQVLNGLLQGTAGVNILRNLDWSLQTVLISLPVLVYHWRILRQDQRLGAEKVPLRKIVTLMCAEPSASLVYSIEEKLGYHIHLLHYLGQTPEDIPVLSDEEVETLASDIQAAPSRQVMLVVTGGKVIVLPYEEK